MKKMIFALALGAFLTVLAAPAVLADGDKEEPQQVPKKCGTTWGGIKSIYLNGASRCK